MRGGQVHVQPPRVKDLIDSIATTGKRSLRQLDGEQWGNAGFVRKHVTPMFPRVTNSAINFESADSATTYLFYLKQC